MASVFVDTNVFLRYLTNDDSGRAARAGRLFHDAVSGRVTLRTSALVIAEMVWTLESFYGLPKSQIAETVEKILNTPNLECDDSARILQALDAYVHENIDYIDAYHFFYMRDLGLARIATYDRKHFGRFPWIEIADL